MSIWRIFPEGAWSAVGSVLSGYGHGEGSYDMAYAVNVASWSLLNGRVSAYIRLTSEGPVSGAGVISRADELRSFVAFYVTTDETAADLYSIRLAAFKLGKLVSMVGLKQAVPIPDRRFHIALQFFSGDMVGQIVTDLGVHT